jgi:hypothetical protein
VRLAICPTGLSLETQILHALAPPRSLSVQALVHCKARTGKRRTLRGVGDQNEGVYPYSLKPWRAGMVSTWQPLPAHLSLTFHDPCSTFHVPRSMVHAGTQEIAPIQGSVR